MQDWIVAAVAVGSALVALGLGVALLRARSRTERALAVARAETAALRAQLDDLERRVALPSAGVADGREQPEFVITNLGAPEPETPRPQVGGALFADLVLRETVVKTAALAHGVRHALDPETRHRIRFEMRREVKRARKQRKLDLRAMRRQREARERAALDADGTVRSGAA